MFRPAALEWIRRRWPRAKPAPPPLRQFQEDRAGRVALVVLLGRDPASLATFVPAAERKLRRFRRRIYLTDCEDLTPFTRAGAIVEVLPRPGDLIGPAAPILVKTYLRDRYRLILAKWEPTIVLFHGMNVEQCLSEIDADIQLQEDEF